MAGTISRRGFSLGMTSGLMAVVPSCPGFAQGTRLKTTIANAAGNLNLAVQELLRQQGYMEEFGLEPTFLNVADGGKILGGLLSGDLDSSMMSGFGQVCDHGVCGYGIKGKRWPLDCVPPGSRGAGP